VYSSSSSFPRRSKSSTCEYTTMNVLGIYKQLQQKIPFGLGNRVFSLFFCMKAPYFRTISPLVEKLDNGVAEVSMKQSWGVQNHIKTVHAIAVCNLVEMTMGCVAESTIPNHLRWLPRGMDVKYVKKATGKLTASSHITSQLFENPTYPHDVIIPVVVKNEGGQVVSTADVQLYISEKKQ